MHTLLVIHSAQFNQCNCQQCLQELYLKFLFSKPNTKCPYYFFPVSLINYCPPCPPVNSGLGCVAELSIKQILLSPHTVVRLFTPHRTSMLGPACMDQLIVTGKWNKTRISHLAPACDTLYILYFFTKYYKIINNYIKFLKYDKM